MIQIGKTPECGFEIFNDLLGENVGSGKIVGFFAALISEPEDFEAGYIVVRSELKNQNVPFFPL
jgi:hypothetical protein